MVVTNYVDGKQLFHEYPYETPGEVLNNVSEALKDLHPNDFERPGYRSTPPSTRGF
ncbi:hypothetical protein BDM02DRAFT_3122881 [Thelephora ganbajun]|uniref:Uncharacterized protein n=1 Tax=Thelephora ganbajun TaxID=370292 RepID=A0ACB6Z2T4_THEGA|nr:hypothetical protein BDM02DRAFT_3122881 [Thelephora ganbajun]